MGSAEPAAYDEVAALYDRAFSDIRVRRVEWRWLTAQLACLPVQRPRVLELGCGTGALLRALAPRIALGVGVDISAAMLDRAGARARESGLAQLSFLRIGDARLPFRAASFDVVISFLSFRYLDWSRTPSEVRRVLRPEGRLLLIDLVAQRAVPRDLPALARSSLRHIAARVRNRSFVRDVTLLTSQPAWRAMLQRHPIRALAEYRQLFEREQPAARFETLDMTPARRVVALCCRP